MKKTLALLLALTMCLSCITGWAEYGDWQDPAYYGITSLKYGNVDEIPDETTVYTNTDGLFPKDSEGNVAPYNQLGVYANDGNGDYWCCLFGSTDTKDVYCRKITDLGIGGKYVVEYDMRFSPLGGGDKYNLNTFFLYDGGGANYMGYSITQQKGQNASVVFHYRNKNASAEVDEEVTQTVGTGLQFNRTVWYKLRHTLDIKNKIATLDVYQGSTVIASYEHKLADDVNGASVNYDSQFQFDTLRIAKLSGTEGFIGIKNMNIIKQTNVPVTATFNDTLVDVTYNGAKVTSGTAVPVPFDSATAAEFTVTPKDSAYEVAEILVDGELINSKSMVSLTNLTEPVSFEVKVTGASFEPLLGKQTFDDLAEDSAFRATETNGNVFYKVNATTDWRHQPVFLGNTGEYTIEHKTNFCGISEDIRTSDIGVYLNFNDTLYSQNKNPLMGFQLAARYKSTKVISVTPQFFFRWNGSEQQLIDLAEPFDLNPDTWYTMRHTYNLDKMSATLYIYDKAGENLIQSYEYDLPEVVPGKDYTIPYTNMTFQCTYISCKIVWLGIDDLSVNKTTQKTITTTYDSTKGTVSCDGETVANGEEIVVAYNNETAKSFTVKPNEEYEIDKIEVNGAEIATDTVDFKNVIEDQTLAVTFKKKEVVAPTVSAAPSYSFDANYENGAAQIAYFTVNPGYGYTFTDGIAKLYEVGNDAEPLKLESAKMLSDYANKNWDGRYGIRVYGKGLTTGQAYVLAPYWVAEDGEGNTETIDPVDKGEDVTNYTFTFGQ